MVRTGKIKALREQNEMTQEVLADFLNVSQPTYARMESGRQKLRVEQLFLLAHVFRVKPIELIDLSNVL
ncbi:putative transcriptional regulator [Owenweeksia hongkongensis DSM 17368]|uniref:Putative transcriptional regulator n=1 Tax=Owenweeksia hongkongensis (strain DSM 17368 / CIP 108786 / JCM 12287 / NRRL B-23963 / UST20020801) TaxID=926562 RepID=G8R2W5_OWEHD|nr:helix-turn-helix transcriptional regulator [Owenweeksia hongkongensis]AEV32959.1 putative transcriptional regulator [Owenweeksia hongkongensis DSM 17368]